MDSNRKAGSQIIPIADMVLYLKDQKTPRSDKHFWQSSSIQNQQTKTSSSSMYQQ
jgi:hypothetical protein